MPWKPSYTEDELAAALAGAETWAAALSSLGLTYHGKNLATARKWALRWGVSTDHLPARTVRPSPVSYTEEQAREAISSSASWAESLRRLGYCPSGGNPTTLKKRAERWGIDTQHFEAREEGLRRAARARRIPLSEILVEGSTYSRGHLKRRLYATGLKHPICELCGQGELWRGRQMSLILDHINGIRDDNRIENLRIVCPNCAATLDTHCGRSHPHKLEPIPCLRCGQEFLPTRGLQRYCSRECGTRWDRSRSKLA